MHRARARVGWLFGTIAAAAAGYLSIVGGMAWWATVPRAAGWQPYVVMSGSMLPALAPGDVALIGPAEVGEATLPPGRLVLVRDGSRSTGSYLHRVVRYDAAGRPVTRGDANPTEDNPSVSPDRVLGEVRLVVPAIGMPMVWSHQDRYAPIAGAAALTWLAILVVVRGRREVYGARHRYFPGHQRGGRRPRRAAAVFGRT
jgi:signal peptidase